LKTYMAKPKDNNTTKWYLFDAEGKILGRLATKIATILMGKHRPEYTPHIDDGDHVIVVNSKKIQVKGANKLKKKMYQTYSGYTGGLKATNLEKMLEKKPDEVIRRAVRKMLPKNYLARHMLQKLKIYSESSHGHEAQKPIAMDI